MSASRSGSCVTGCASTSLGGHVALAHRDTDSLRRCAATRAATSASSSSSRPLASRYARRLQRGHVDHRRPQRQHVVRVVLQRHDLVQVAGRRLAEAVHERAVDLAGLDRDPRLVQRPRRVHLDVALAHRRPRAHRVEPRRRTRTARPAGSRGCPSTRSRCSFFGMPDSATAACIDGHDHLDLVVLDVVARPPTARERHNRNVSHQSCPCTARRPRRARRSAPTRGSTCGRASARRPTSPSRACPCARLRPRQPRIRPKNVLLAPSSRICADTYGISGASSDRPGMFTTQNVVIAPLSCTSTSIDVGSPVFGSVPRDAAYTSVDAGRGRR